MKLTSISCSEKSEQKIFENLISKQELAEFLNLSMSMVDKMMQQGLPHFKIGKSVRFKVSDVVSFLDRRRRP